MDSSSFSPFLLSSMLLVVAVGASHAEIDPKLYWDEVLPFTAMPSSIQKLLPDVYEDDKAATSVNVGKGGVNVHTGKGTVVGVGHGGVGVSTGNSKPGGTTVNVGKGGVGVNTGRGTVVGVGHGGVGVSTGNPKHGGTTVNVGKGGVGVHTSPKGKPAVVHVNPVGTPFNYIYAASDKLIHDPAAGLFFLRNDLRRGKQFNLQLAASGAVASPFIPRQAADDIPFSTAEFSSILSRFNIPAGSAEAATMKGTLAECEAAPAAGETKRCATSLEAMVDFATTSLGTRDVVAVSTEGGGASAAKRQAYKVEAVRRVARAGRKGLVACHPEAYAYAIFFCHATSAADVYTVDLAAVGGGGSPARAAAVCHTDTAGWNPKNVAFKVLGVKPGTANVCHFLPEDHVVWAKKE